MTHWNSLVSMPPVRIVLVACNSACAVEVHSGRKAEGTTAAFAPPTWFSTDEPARALADLSAGGGRLRTTGHDTDERRCGPSPAPQPCSHSGPKTCMPGLRRVHVRETPEGCESRPKGPRAASGMASLTSIPGSDRHTQEATGHSGDRVLAGAGTVGDPAPALSTVEGAGAIAPTHRLSSTRSTVRASNQSRAASRAREREGAGTRPGVGRRRADLRGLRSNWPAPIPSGRVRPLTGPP